MYIDGHCDSLSRALNKGWKINEHNLRFNYDKVVRPCIQICAVFVHDKFEDGFKRANDIINFYFKNQQDTKQVINLRDIELVEKEKRVGVLLSIENGKAIENDLDKVNYFYNLGVRMMGIVWNNSNLLGCGALTLKDTGLTELGRKYIKKLNETNMIIDISHCSEKTFWDICDETKGLIVASHSCCKGICNHTRNLTDDQIKEIAKRNGVIGLCFVSKFLKEEGTANVYDIVKHIEYIINLVGVDYVALGTDFDGIDEEQELEDIKNVSQMNILVNLLEEKGYSKENINKIIGDNWKRVIKINFLNKKNIE